MVYDVSDILDKSHHVFTAGNITSETMVNLKTEIRRKRVSVAENILNYGFVCCRDHGMKIIAVFDLVYVRPSRQVDVRLWPEMDVFSIDNQIDISLDYNDDEVVFGLSWFGVYDMVRSLYFAGKNIVINVSHPFDGFLAEEDCWLGVLDSDFAHRV